MRNIIIGVTNPYFLKVIINNNKFIGILKISCNIKM